MKISEISSKYKTKFGRSEVIIEEARNEKGETIYIYTSLISVNLPNGEKWSPKIDDAKDLDRSNSSEDLKRNIRKLLQLL
ncbi:hypothetical protein BFU36_03000 [Sulfolobus sp. A20]|uniref:hypothetical protein n=1 Tax=Sulfolobaceae TaxID=118883 RepID=UPI0008461374|nr:MULTISPECIES: hypothetical protein [unclassified Sulfolobus]TRM76475.1 hypothetical protein DJ523_01000 [Sulfolobus sp. E5]TRM76712.1 hypothetical protein DJ532_06845 [Sulfolobus sp. A20-N-F8]TRM76908.1 hypothetical protein DJ528_07640 [Sulfolobus sp. B5]TRM82762.1 hypothetical protein DJ531_08445 [Sulfolobus sp. A20-N-F6]TRM87755.1 hypothetical protein DJ529_07420 [Sulfolobus sp. C3]TRM93363.1 hypothetical protein DJ526_04165 [Sulfolobus sp. A20-N-G8]TRM98810.1 hypothetical protein DJ527